VGTYIRIARCLCGSWASCLKLICAITNTHICICNCVTTEKQHGQLETTWIHQLMITTHWAERSDIRTAASVRCYATWSTLRRQFDMLTFIDMCSVIYTTDNR